MNRCRALLALPIVALLLSGCGESSTASAPETEAGRPAWLLAEAPDGAVAVAQAKGGASEGETVIVRGLIGGQKDALTPGSPVFRIIDAGVENACVSEDDHCATPWDYCCADDDVVRANSATVQITGTGEIDPIAAGLEPLDEVVVVGTVGPRPNPEVMTIRANEVYVARN